MTHRWSQQSRSSIADTVRAATEAAAAVRKAAPERHPPTPHSWFQLRADEDELGAPILCTSCFTRIDPEGSVSMPWLHREESHPNPSAVSKARKS